MRVINCEPNKYRTLTYGDFLTDDKFDFEIAHPQYTLNPVLWKKGFTLLSKSNHIEWIKSNYNSKYFNYDSFRFLIKTFSKENRLRIKGKEKNRNWGKELFEVIYNNLQKVKHHGENIILEDVTYPTFNSSLLACLIKEKDNQYQQAFKLLERTIQYDESFIHFYLKTLLRKYMKELEKNKFFILSYDIGIQGYSKRFNNEKDIFSFISDNKKIITGITNFRESTDPVWIVSKEIKYKKEIFKDFLKKKQGKSIIELQRLRELLLSGKTLVFLYNGLVVQVKPPLVNSVSHFDFSMSILINNKPISQINDEEHKAWVKEKGKDSFRAKLFELINADSNIKLKDDTSKKLLSHLANIKSIKISEIQKYIITYFDDKEEKQKNALLSEFNEERVRLKASHKLHIFENQIINVNPWSYKKHMTA